MMQIMIMCYCVVDLYMSGIVLVHGSMQVSCVWCSCACSETSSTPQAIVRCQLDSCVQDKES